MNAISILDAVDSPQLFRGWFKNAATWTAWRSFLKALFGLPMSEDDLAIFKQCTGRDQPPTTPSLEAALVVGRRGGKSFILAVIACFLAVFRTWSQHLVPGERAVILVIAVDRKQAKVIYRYA